MRETGQVRVGIRLESSQEEETTITEYKGTLYRKPHAVFLRYEETGEDGSRSAVTVRFDGGVLRIVRRGEVDSEQSYAVGKRLAGSYKSPYMKLGLETDTDHLQMTGGDRGGLPVTLEWRYGLWVNEEWMGRFDLRLYIQEELAE
jgi:uncharacterized beta-barrel protein YwiB (DUF1934 family)